MADINFIDLFADSADLLTLGVLDDAALPNAVVHVKRASDAPEEVMPNARVRVYDYATGALAWQGNSMKDGTYVAVRLQRGRRYVPVALDLTEEFECVASGPSTAGGS